MKRGLIWQIPKDEFQTLVSRSKTLIEIVRFLGYRNMGGGYRMLKKRLIEDNINFSHISLGLCANKGKSYKKFKPISHEKLFCKGSLYPSSTIRRYVARDKLIEYKCKLCGLGPEWNGKPLTLILDHINGDNTDNRLENLRFICPNCDMQTDTHGGRNIDWSKSPFTKRMKTKSLFDIQNQISRCPPKDILEKIVWEKPTTHIAKDFGVTDKAVTKWCRKYDIKKPEPGYWAKMKPIKAGTVITEHGKQFRVLTDTTAHGCPMVEEIETGRRFIKTIYQHIKA
jgi:hypothetical protein